MIAVRASIEDDFRDGRLVTPLDLPVSMPGAHHLAFHLAFHLACSQVGTKSPQLKAFEEWLVEEAMADERGL
jgi:LysR family glycine cleavage system transcriptional activator